MEKRLSTSYLGLLSNYFRFLAYLVSGSYALVVLMPFVLRAVPRSIVLAIFGGFIPPPGGFYPSAGGIKLDLRLITIPTVSPYKKQGEEAGERGKH
jgi:hypothetical protein